MNNLLLGNISFTWSVSKSVFASSETSRQWNETIGAGQVLILVILLKKYCLKRKLFDHFSVYRKIFCKNLSFSSVS